MFECCQGRTDDSLQARTGHLGNPGAISFVGGYGWEYTRRSVYVCMYVYMFLPQGLRVSPRGGPPIDQLARLCLLSCIYASIIYQIQRCIEATQSV